MASFFDYFFGFASKRKRSNTANIAKLKSHQLLCVPENATPEQVNAQYKKMALAIHPDKNGYNCYEFFMIITHARDTLLKMPAQAMPLITHIFYAHQCGDLLQTFPNIVRNKNPVALENLCEELSDLGLDHIGTAFVIGVNNDMLCYKCNNRLKHIDELCYCRESEERCHHRNCCAATPNRSNRADLAKLKPHEILCVPENATPEQINENYKRIARAIHPDKNGQNSDELFKIITDARNTLLKMPAPVDHQMEESAVVVKLPPFTKVFEVRQCDVIIMGMRYLPKNADEAQNNGPLSNGQINLLNVLCRISTDYALEGMMMAYKKALNSNFVCHKCQKQLQLDDICYCPNAAATCHCNLRNCCGTAPQSHGSFF